MIGIMKVTSNANITLILKKLILQMVAPGVVLKDPRPTRIYKSKEAEKLVDDCLMI